MMFTKLLRAAVTTALVLGVTSPTLAQDTPEAGAPPATVSAAVQALVDAPPAKWTADYSEERRSSGGPFGGGGMMMGAIQGNPFEGSMEIIVGKEDRLFASSQQLPGFALLERGSIRAKHVLFLDDPIDFNAPTRAIGAFLDPKALAEAFQNADWGAEENSTFTTTLPKDMIPKGETRQIGPMNVSLEGKVLEIRARALLDASGALSRLDVEIDRNDPMAGMMAGFGRGGSRGGADAVASTQFITLQPSAEAPTKRAQRLRAELTAALASRAREAISRRGGGSRERIRPASTGGRAGAAIPDAVRSRFRATIDKYDTDGDGALSESEAADRWPRLKGYDSNGDGKVDLPELLAGYQKRAEEARRPAGDGR